MSNAAFESALHSARLLKEAGYGSGAVYESGRYQRAADHLALRGGLANVALLGGGAAALSAAFAAASRYSAHQKEHMDEAIQPVAVPLYAGKKRRKPGAAPEADPAAPPAVKSSWWGGPGIRPAPKPGGMFLEGPRKWQGLSNNSGDPRSEQYGYAFSIPAGIAALAAGGWLGKKLVDRLHGKARVQRSADDMADAEADFNQAMFDLSKTSAVSRRIAGENARHAPAAGEKNAISVFSLPTMLLGLGSMYGAYRLYRDSKERKTTDPKNEYIRTLSRHIARGQFPELTPLYENEFDPEAEIVPNEETGAGANSSGARPAR